MSSAFELNVEPGGVATLTLDVPGKKLNVFTREVIEELSRVTDQVAGRDDIEILVLLSGKDEGFIAGADIDMIAGLTDPSEAEASTRQGQAVFQAWEDLPFPTVAAIRGTCVGGGLELALASTHRVMAHRSQDRIGLPEIQLGILPALGGSTRLPRLIGLPEALDIILAGKTIPPKKAYKLGLVDALLPEENFRAHVRDFAQDHKGRGRSRRKEGLDVKKLLLSRNPMGRKVVFDKARSSVLERTGGNYPAPLRAIDVIRTGLEDGREAGFAAEARAMGELAITTTAKNLIHVFNLTQEAKKWQGLDGGEPVDVNLVAVLGAGAMGGGIAQLAAHKIDVPVRLKDISEDALASGMEEAAKLFGKLEQRRRLTTAERRRKMALLQPTLHNTGLGRVDVLIEAIVENMDIKQKVLAEVEAELPEHAVLATNTSSLSVAGIGAQTRRPERVVGMHFFNPVHKMPLVEVVAPEGASPEAVNTIFQLSKDLGKTPVLVKDEPGFLVNRLLTFYSIEAMWLLDEGYSIEDVDRVLKNWGWPVGPIALGDEVGLDVSVKVGHVLHEAFSDRLPLPGWMDRLVEAQRLGKKTQSGFYRYEDGKRVEPDPAVYRILGLTPTIENPDPRVIIDRTVLPMVDEAARCLDEGIVRSAAELDLAMIFGTGFPPFRGGLARWADREGVTAVVEALERFAETVDPRYAPSQALRDVAEAGGFYDKYGSGED